MKTIVILDYLWNTSPYEKQAEEIEHYVKREEGLIFSKSWETLYLVLDIPHLPRVGDHVSTRFGMHKVDYVMYELEPNYEGFESNPEYYFDSMSRICLKEL